MNKRFRQTGRDVQAPADIVVPDEPFPPRGFRIWQVCKMTGLGRTTIYAAIKAGDLISRKYGGCAIVLADDLDAFLRGLPNAREVQPQREPKQ
jgi:hypothetical protein